MRTCTKLPPQGQFNWDDVVKYLQEIGALNKKYDSDLDGIVDKASDANTVGGHAPGTSAGNVLVLNTAGQVPLANIPPISATQIGFSFAWEKVARVTTSGVASISFTGLAGDIDILYLIIGTVVNIGAIDTYGIYVRYNADTTLGNYAYIAWENSAGTVSSIYQSLYSTSGVAGCVTTGLHANAIGIFACLIKATGITYVTNNYAMQVSYGFDSNSVRYTNAGGLYKRSAEITEIELFTESGATINWDVTLFKPKW